MLPDREHHFLDESRVAHLATADARAVPHVVPVCFALAGRTLYITIDAKPKRAPGGTLKRVQNILANPTVAVVVDRYDEDWARLGWVMLRGQAEILADGLRARRRADAAALALSPARGHADRPPPRHRAAHRAGDQLGRLVWVLTDIPFHNVTPAQAGAQDTRPAGCGRSKAHRGCESRLVAPTPSLRRDVGARLRGHDVGARR